MSGYFAARDVQPVDFVGNMMKGIDNAQRHQENNFRLNALQTQSDWQKDSMEAQQLMRAMQLGASSPKTWDASMQALAEAGNKQAARYVGQWSPLRAPRLLEQYKKAYGFGGGSAAAAGGRQAAPAEPDAVSFDDDQQKRLEQAVAAMPPEQRNQTMRNYEHMLRAMDGVKNEADLDAMLEDFVGRRMMPPEVAQQYKLRYASPDSMWKNFQEDFQKVSGLRNALAQYTTPGQLGIPVGQQPSYKSEWDDTNQLGVITKTSPGQAPEFSVQRPGGIPAGGITGGKWPEGMKDTVTTEGQFREQWRKNIEPTMALKSATDMLMSLDPKTNSGVSDVAAVYQFIKALDPTSVVREGEIALLGEARSLLERLKGSATRVQQGRTLTPKLLEDMQTAAKRLREIAHDNYAYRRQKEMESIAPFAGYIDSNRAFPDYWSSKGFVEPPPPPVTGTGKQSSGIGGVPNPGDDIERVPGDY
jgi:hypothetical protein